MGTIEDGSNLDGPENNAEGVGSVRDGPEVAGERLSNLRIEGGGKSRCAGSFRSS